MCVGEGGGQELGRRSGGRAKAAILLAMSIGSYERTQKKRERKNTIWPSTTHVQMWMASAHLKSYFSSSRALPMLFVNISVQAHGVRRALRPPLDSLECSVVFVPNAKVRTRFQPAADVRTDTFVALSEVGVLSATLTVDGVHQTSILWPLPGIL